MQKLESECVCVYICMCMCTRLQVGFFSYCPPGLLFPAIFLSKCLRSASFLGLKETDWFQVAQLASVLYLMS